MIFWVFQKIIKDLGKQNRKVHQNICSMKITYPFHLKCEVKSGSFKKLTFLKIENFSWLHFFVYMFYFYLLRGSFSVTFAISSSKSLRTSNTSSIRTNCGGRRYVLRKRFKNMFTFQKRKHKRSLSTNRRWILIYRLRSPSRILMISSWCENLCSFFLSFFLYLLCQG